MGLWNQVDSSKLPFSTSAINVGCLSIILLNIDSKLSHESHISKIFFNQISFKEKKLHLTHFYLYFLDSSWIRFEFLKLKLGRPFQPSPSNSKTKTNLYSIVHTFTKHENQFVSQMSLQYYIVSNTSRNTHMGSYRYLQIKLESKIF